MFLSSGGLDIGGLGLLLRNPTVRLQLTYHHACHLLTGSQEQLTTGIDIGGVC